MNILQIATKIPYPLNDGGKIGIYNITKSLSLLSHKVTFVTFASAQRRNIGDLGSYARVELVEHEPRSSVFAGIRALVSEVPYTIGKYYIKPMRDRIHMLLSREEFDLMHVDHLHMSRYGVEAKREFGLPIFLREHNFETAIWERFSQAQKNPLLKSYGYNQLKKVRAYEALMVQHFDRCLMVSKEDEAKLRGISRNVRTAVVPAGVDVSYFEPATGESEEPNSILFLGSLDWLPNQDAFWWFFESILPKILERFLRVKLYVVGKNPPRRFERISHRNVTVFGYVDDIRPYVRRSTVCVVPLRVGGGMRIKILEMLAMKKAIVSTSTGCEGIELHDGREILIADDENTFAEKVCTLLGEETLRRSLGEAGRSLIEKRYQWRTVVQELVSVYKETLHKKLSTAEV